MTALLRARGIPSPRQFEILRSIIRHFATHFESPSYRDIAAACDTGVGDVTQMVEVLALKGWLIAPGHSRSLIVLADPDSPEPVRPALALVRSEESRLSELAAALRCQLRDAEDSGSKRYLTDAHDAAMARLMKERE